MLAYALRRLLALVPTLFGLLVFVFFLGRALPGDPATTMAGPEATEEEVRVIREAWGLDEPILVQFATYVANVSRGEFGRSLQTGRPVMQEIADRLPNSLLLTAVAMGIALIVGTVVGVVSAARPYSLIDVASMVTALLLLSTPVFWLALMLIIVFAVELGWLPVFGAASWKHLVLPAASLAAATTGMIARFARSSMLEVLGEDYIRTAWAKGASERQVLLKHALRVSLVSIVTVSGLQFGVLLGGSVLTETIFSWPGLGKFMYDTILARDYPGLQAATLVFALVVALLNLAVDLSYGLIDPRVRYE